MGSLAVLVTGAQPPGLLRLGVLVLHLATPCVPDAYPKGWAEDTPGRWSGARWWRLTRRLDAVRGVDPLLVALGLLTLVTGLVDAACYLGLGRVFTANMTGNVVLLAFGAAGTQGLPVLGPTVSLMVFLVGAAGGGRLAGRLVGPANTPVSASARQRWLTITLLIELGLVITAGVVAIGLPVDGGGTRRYVVIALLAAALGLQNATVRRLAVPDLTTTVLTLTLTGLAADFGVAGRSPRVGRRLAAVGLMAAGALVGALLLRVDVALPVLAAAVVIALATVVLRFGGSRETT
jgi:uncharacterized membrane protein YoaK (UPF0700 family)